MPPLARQFPLHLPEPDLRARHQRAARAVDVRRARGRATFARTGRLHGPRRLCLGAAHVKLGSPSRSCCRRRASTPVALAFVIGAPTLRLSGVYLAIATIGLGEVLRILYLNSDYAGGALGLNGIPEAARVLDDLRPARRCASRALAASAASRIGRAMEAIREDETAAGVMGVNLPRYKLAALVASAAIAGVAGALQRTRPASSAPTSMDSTPPSPSSASRCSAASARRSARCSAPLVLTAAARTAAAAARSTGWSSTASSSSAPSSSCRAVCCPGASGRIGRAMTSAARSPGPHACASPASPPSTRSTSLSLPARARAHRPERRGQDHALQPDLRHDAAERRAPIAFDGATRRPADPPAHARSGSPAPSRTSACSAR